MAVPIERDADVGVSEHLGYDLRVHVLLKQPGGGRVAQIVEPKPLDPGALEQRPERPAPEVRRVHGPADLVREYQTAVIPSVAGSLALLALLALSPDMANQRIDGELGE